MNDLCANETRSFVKQATAHLLFNLLLGLATG